jgi:hypothetical protein
MRLKTLAVSKSSTVWFISMVSLNITAFCRNKVLHVAGSFRDCTVLLQMKDILSLANLPNSSETI